jgi:hypothetical protein
LNRADDGFSERVVIRVITIPDRRRDAGVGEPIDYQLGLITVQSLCGDDLAVTTQ